jgi:hypothetical protein
MRDRLIELLIEASEGVTTHCVGDCEFCADKIADHLLSNGVIVSPCKVGQTVFIIDEGDEGSDPYVLDVAITAYGYDISGFWATLNLPLGLKMSAHFGERMFGKTVFLAKEEAEKALAERSENGKS